MFFRAGGVISTTKKFPRKSAAAAREAPLARVLRGRLRGRIGRVDPDCCHPAPGEAGFEGEDENYGCDTGGGGVYGDANCFQD